MSNHFTSEENRAFRAAFESQAIEPGDFSHEAHLRLAYVYLVEVDVASAQQRMRAALIAFLQFNGLPAEKFHETLTRAWVLAVRHFMGRDASRSFAEFLNQSQPLRGSNVMLKHYSRDLLFSAVARAAYVEPDLAAIPG